MYVYMLNRTAVLISMCFNDVWPKRVTNHTGTGVFRQPWWMILPMRDSVGNKKKEGVRRGRKVRVTLSLDSLFLVWMFKKKKGKEWPVHKSKLCSLLLVSINDCRKHMHWLVWIFMVRENLRMYFHIDKKKSVSCLSVIDTYDFGFVIY